MKKTLATMATMFLVAACGGETLDIGGSSMGTGGGPLNDGGGDADNIPPGPTNSTVIAPHQRGAWFLQLSGEYLYWLSSVQSSGGSLTSILRRCRTDDCASTLEDVLPGAGAVQIHSGNLYFWISGANTISSCPIGDCTSPKVLVGAADMVSLYVDNSGIYWSTRLDTSIYKCPLTGCDAPERTIVG
ncbi:MAG: hypothetical protein ABW133_16955, partial [Polyangiaceae bacterium]